jgi:hypothetical protein
VNNIGKDEKAVVAYFPMLSCDFPGGTEEFHEKIASFWDEILTRSFLNSCNPTVFIVMIAVYSPSS